MHCFSHFHRALRPPAIATVLALGLLGCGNAPAGAAARASQDLQDWEVEPKLWVPRPILIPRIGPPIPVAGVMDSSRNDSTKPDSTKPDSTKPDSTKPDSTKPDSTKPDSTRADSGKASSAPAIRPVILPRKRSFVLSPRDSARWPVKGPEPLPGAIVPEHRIVAFYGNPLSKRMGILGEIEPDEMLRRLEEIATEWAAADSGQKVLPALHLIATVAQGYPGPARLYRLQMPDSLIDRVASWAEQRGWLLFLDIQVGVSTVERELPRLIPFLARPYVHLALDPEFAMKDGKKPGTDWMGRMDAEEVNHAIGVLAKVVEKHQLPPKVLVVHRFTRNMLTNASKIRLDPRVQVIIDMDGYGSPSAKKAAYRWFVVQQPVQYTGMKLFFKNDKPVMTPEEVLEIYPKPMYIQYQ